MGVREDERVNVPVCVLDILLSMSCADRRWKMTRADKHASYFPSHRRQKHGQPVLFNLFAELFPCVVLTLEGTEEHGPGRDRGAGYTIEYEDIKVLPKVQCNNER